MTTPAIKVLSPEQISENIQLIHTVIESFEAIGEPAAILEYLGKVISLQALATETSSSAGWWREWAMDQELDRQAALDKEHRIAPSIKKARADAKVRDWNYQYERADGLSRKLTHTIDAVRTKISYLKQEMHSYER